MISQYLELTFLVLRRDFIIRYRGTFIGYFWSLLNPLMFAFVYVIAFKHILRIPVENYAIFLLAGLYPWLWISNSLSNASNGFSSYQSILKSRQTTPHIIPFFIVLTEFTNFLFTIPVILIFVYFSPAEIPVTSVFYFPIIFILTFGFLISLVSIISCLSLILRDLGHFVQLLVQLLFFLSPILYPLSLITDQFLKIYLMNPFVNLIQLWRQVLYSGDVDLSLILYPFAFTLGMFLVSWFCMKRIGHRAVQWL